MKKQPFFRSASLPIVTNLLSLSLYCALRVLLLRASGVDGAAYFSPADAIFLLMAVGANAGAPAVIARLVARAQSRGDFSLLRRILSGSLLACASAGVVFAAALALSAPTLSKLVGLDGAQTALYAAAGIILLASLLGALRGYFDGRRLYAPSAVAQLLSAALALLVGAILAKSMAAKGAQYAALGAAIGVAAGQLLALVFSGGLCLLERPGSRAKKAQLSARENISASVLSRRTFLLLIANSFAPLCFLLDAPLILGRMQEIGYPVADARAAYGLYAGVVFPLILLFAAISSAFSLTLVPSIAAYAARKEIPYARAATRTGTKMCVLVALPVAALLFVLGKPFLALLYGDALAAGQLAVAEQLTQCGAAAVLFLALAGASTAVLGALRLERLGALSAIVALAVKIVAGIILVAVPSVNAAGAAVSTAAACGVLALLNTAQMARRTGIRLNLLDVALKPLIAVGCMGTAVYFLFFGFFQGMYSQVVDMLLSFVLGLVIYFAIIVLLRAVSKEDFSFLPGGKKALEAFTREGLYKK